MRTIVCVFLMFLPLGAMAQSIFPTTSTFMVEITGSAGLEFSGSCMTTTTTNTANSDAAGRVPKTYMLQGVIVSCVVQKKQERGTLNLRITRANGTVVGESTTSQPYGVATLGGR